MIGRKIGLLTVVERLHRDEKLGRLFRCTCECGNEKTVPHSNLLTGNTKSCGCLKRKKSNLPFAGASRLREYQVWKHMKFRCYDPAAKGYDDYGAKGVTVCDAWKNDFSAFIDFVGLRPSPRHTIDRIDPTGNYEPGNVRWATMKEQQNNKRKNIRVTHNGITMTVTQWADFIGIQRATLSYRLRMGWPMDQAMTPKKYSPYRKLL